MCTKNILIISNLLFREGAVKLIFNITDNNQYSLPGYRSLYLLCARAVSLPVVYGGSQSLAFWLCF